MILELTHIKSEPNELKLHEVLDNLSARIKQDGDNKLAQIASLLTNILTERKPREVMPLSD